MKIVIFSDNVAPYRIQWAEELAKEYDVTFAYVKEKDSGRNDSWLVKSSNKVKLVKLPATVIKNRAFSLAIIEYIMKWQCDVVIFDGYGTIPNMLGMVYMNRLHKKFFVNVDGVTLDALDTRLKKVVKRTIFGSYGYFLCSSDFTKKSICNVNISPDRCIVHNFSSIHEKDILTHVPTTCDRAKMRNRLGLDNLITVIAVGRFLKLKQFDMLIKAFQPFDESYQLLIIGEGAEKAAYEDLIKTEKLLHTRIISFMEFDALRDYYIASDVLVLPSYSEVWGLVVNEGMGCGALPAIVSDRCVVGYSLVEDGEAGFQFEYNNMLDLRKKLGILLEDNNLREKMSQSALEKIKDYTIERMARVHIKWIESKMSDLHV